MAGISWGERNGGPTKSDHAEYLLFCTAYFVRDFYFLPAGQKTYSYVLRAIKLLPNVLLFLLSNSRIGRGVEWVGGTGGGYFAGIWGTCRVHPLPWMKKILRLGFCSYFQVGIYFIRGWIPHKPRKGDAMLTSTAQVSAV